MPISLVSGYRGRRLGGQPSGPGPRQPRRGGVRPAVSPMVAVASPTRSLRSPPTRPLRSPPTRSLPSARMAQEVATLPGRPYPPPPAPEPLWPAQATVLGAIALQLLLPDRLTVGPSWLIPALEGALFVGLSRTSPRRLEHEHPRRRWLAIGLVAFVGAANVYSLGALAHYLLHHHVAEGRGLIVSGSLIWLTNFLIFALWYWEMARGGPGRRAAGRDGAPDFLFPQMTDDRIQPDGWRPGFVDYLYVSLTNATAFSPTDTMPLTPTAKIVMGIQSMVSLVTIGLIVSRAVNILAVTIL